MKNYFYLFMFLMLFGCEDESEVIVRYSSIKTEYKNYPVFLDISEFLKIQVLESIPQTEPFKIVYNDKYYFVGERLKGIHVYKKETGGNVEYMCFIECRYITDFEIVGNLLYCNNFVDLVVIEVSDPLHINILHRQINHFNQFTGHKEYWNFPYVEGKGFIAEWVTHTLTGIVTDQMPNLDFTELDQLYSNLTTTVVPDSWFKNELQDDRPSPGIIKTGIDEVYTYGSYGSWFICAYQDGSFSLREEDWWSSPLGKYVPPTYYSNAFPVRMIFEDNMIYILGSDEYPSGGYSDCHVYHDELPFNYHFYFPTFKPLDICYMPELNAFMVLSEQSIWGAYVSGNIVDGIQTIYKEYHICTGAIELLRVDDKLLALGDDLSIYTVSENELSLVKKYPEVSGMCCKLEGDYLTVANAQGLFIYNISDLENIQLIL